VKRLLIMLAVVGTVWTVAALWSVAALAQAPNEHPSSASVNRGRTVFQQKCNICHNDTSNVKKIGPGLKGLNKRGTFSVNGHRKVTDKSLTTWIQDGDSLMPAMKDALDQNQLKDVVAYVKTL
jgi:mono/diheme cytochrome c family protein